MKEMCQVYYLDVSRRGRETKPNLNQSQRSIRFFLRKILGWFLATQKLFKVFFLWNYFVIASFTFYRSQSRRLVCLFCTMIFLWTHFSFYLVSWRLHTWPVWRGYPTRSWLYSRDTWGKFVQMPFKNYEWMNEWKQFIVHTLKASDSKIISYLSDENYIPIWEWNLNLSQSVWIELWILLKPFHYSRLVIALAIVVFYACAVFPYTGSGPLWNRVNAVETDACLKNWWLNLLMVSNYVDTENIVSFLVLE